MQVEEFLEQSAARTPEKTAVVCGKTRLTYGEIEASANRLAHRLIGHGVKRGDRVAISVENSTEAVISLFATLKAGGVFVFVNPMTKEDKLVWILNNCRAAALITDVAKARSAGSRLAESVHLKAVWVVGAGTDRNHLSFDKAITDSAAPDTRPAGRSIDLDLAALVYTSGSTGRPKGVMATHLNMISAADSVTSYLENSAGDVILNVLPLSSSYGLYQVLMMFKVGGTIVLERSFTYPYKVVETIIRENVTGLPIVPTISAILIQLNLSTYHLPALRYITNAGAALPTHHITRLRELFPQVRLYSMYGLTECKRVSYLPPDQIDIRPASVGRGMPNQEVYVVDDDGGRVGPGVVGELVIRGSNVTRGYWEDPEATARALRPGPIPGEKVLYSGDLFKTDEEGYLYFVSRKDDIIKTRGEKVSPREVEEVLYGIEGVAEAAVFGVPDPVLGSAVKAVLTLREGMQVNEAAVLRHCSQKLENFMVPKFVEFRASMPRTTSGKIAKRQLAAVAGQAS
jgi:amino acid adenylation domain-containing protein